MRDPARLLTTLALSFPMWMSIAAGIWLTSRAFHITFPIPGFVPRDDDSGRRRGGADARRDRGLSLAYQFAVTTFFGADVDRAVGAAIVLHAISFVPVTLLGIVFMMREGLTLTGARRMAEEAAGHPERGDTPA